MEKQTKTNKQTNKRKRWQAIKLAPIKRKKNKQTKKATCKKKIVAGTEMGNFGNNGDDEKKGTKKRKNHIFF